MFLFGWMDFLFFVIWFHGRSLSLKHNKKSAHNHVNFHYLLWDKCLLHEDVLPHRLSGLPRLLHPTPQVSSAETKQGISS